VKKKSKVKYFYNFSPFLGINVSTNRMQIQGYYIYILALALFIQFSTWFISEPNIYWIFQVNIKMGTIYYTQYMEWTL
jgi:hypothetical protein